MYSAAFRCSFDLVQVGRSPRPSFALLVFSLCSIAGTCRGVPSHGELCIFASASEVDVVFCNVISRGWSWLVSPLPPPPSLWALCPLPSPPAPFLVLWLCAGPSALDWSSNVRLPSRLTVSSGVGLFLRFCVVFYVPLVVCGHLPGWCWPRRPQLPSWCYHLLGHRLCFSFFSRH